MKKKKKIIVLLVLLAVLIQLHVSANEEHGRDLDIVIGEILENSQSETLSEVSVKEVSPGLLEELGDVVMGLILNDDWRHERMDAMLGGEGSYQLAAYHRNLGEQYILSGGNLNRIYFPRGGMMGVSHFSPIDSQWNQYNYRSNWYYWALPIFFTIVVILVIVMMISIRRRDQKPGNQALMILKKRFVNGEISQQEYKKMEKVIRN